MIVRITTAAEADLADGYWFYEHQSLGLGNYFRSCLIADIESLAYYGSAHCIVFGYHQSLSKRFPFAIYYSVENETIIVVAVLDARQNPSWIRKRLS
jgi:plasmid stabilization system protein ParE